jgi:ABC-type lipoprotein release transport system permease subunit
VTPSDPVTFALSAAILIAAAVLSSLIPAQKAACIDPVSALRQD